MTEAIIYCSRCGYPVTMDPVPDPKSDREHPDMAHIGCLTTERDTSEQATQPSAPGEFSQIPLFLCRLSKTDRAALRRLGVNWQLFT